MTEPPCFRAVFLWLYLRVLFVYPSCSWCSGLWSMKDTQRTQSIIFSLRLLFPVIKPGDFLIGHMRLPDDVPV